MNSVHKILNQSVRIRAKTYIWDIKLGDLYRTFGKTTKRVASNVVTEILVRYRHSNLNDLSDFYSYELPKDKESTKYEKNAGEKLSDFKVTQL